MTSPSLLISLPDATLAKLLQIKFEYFVDKYVEQHTNLQLMNLLLECKLVKPIHKFKIGDTICSFKNLEMGIPFFFVAGDYDVEHYSGQYWPCGKKKMYYKIV